MPQFEKHFTLAEAQALVPWVRGVIERIHVVLEALENPEPVFHRTLEADGVERESDRQTGGAVSAQAAPRAVVARLSPEERKKLAGRLVQAILEQGIVVQDLRRGLIDFPAWRDGREVLLCYELADGETIDHWHELDAGYAGRQKIHADDDL